VVTWVDDTQSDIRGQVFDPTDVGSEGYIAGATVFADADNDGCPGPDEASTKTDANGFFTLFESTGPLVLIGGTDIPTGLPFTGVLRARRPDLPPLRRSRRSSSPERSQCQCAGIGRPRPGADARSRQLRSDCREVVGRSGCCGRRRRRAPLAAAIQ
jgi:hypothetical protein